MIHVLTKKNNNQKTTLFWLRTLVDFLKDVLIILCNIRVETIT